MSKKAKFAVVVGVIAAIVSAVILVIVFWDRLISLLPWGKDKWEEDFQKTEDDDVTAFTADELSDFADLKTEE